jgi:hypothetical protein
MTESLSELDLRILDEASHLLDRVASTAPFDGAALARRAVQREARRRKRVTACTTATALALAIGGWVIASTQGDAAQRQGIAVVATPSTSSAPTSTTSLAPTANTLPTVSQVPGSNTAGAQSVPGAMPTPAADVRSYWSEFVYARQAPASAIPAVTVAAALATFHGDSTLSSAQRATTPTTYLGSFTYLMPTDATHSLRDRLAWVLTLPNPSSAPKNACVVSYVVDATSGSPLFDGSDCAPAPK